MNEVLALTDHLVKISVWIGFLVISISVILLMYQTIVGPENVDRAVALDTIAVNLMAVAGLLAIYLVTDKLNDIVLLIGVLAFLGTVGIAKYLEEGVIIDRN
ncbi:monovalent cation/H+ antiporter complex subunit F [Oceanobacillus sp. Castelsardo]|uniref:monovalent cation/H+ antiporter complex subunit F n=1 Tax=Oceanobacillus sp. Castelsardo TaxID=1851204 RepID=UPI000839238D|nr:monovalent cation/H+ antiporter complex subunit F [Oceanobacillus sp. Castelsardo]